MRNSILVIAVTLCLISTTLFAQNDAGQKKPGSISAEDIIYLISCQKSILVRVEEAIFVRIKYVNNETS